MRTFLSNRFVKLLCVVIAAYGFYEGFMLWKMRNDGFNVENIYTKLPNSPSWDIAVTAKKHEEIKGILAQHFTYIGRGFQFYAFESSDGLYVLKFMRHQRLHPPVMYDWFPDCEFVRDLKAKKAKKRQDRVDILFLSLKIAYVDIPEETGLIYVHLNKANDDLGTVKIVDLLDSEYTIALDETEFVLQKKATFVKPTIKALMKAGKATEAKERINQLFALLKESAKKGILDIDGALVRKNNVGFLADRAMYIDTGRFVYKDNINTKERFSMDLKRLRPLYKWLMSNYPALAVHYEREQKRVVDSF